MAPRPLEILRKGLNNFSKKMKARKDTLILKLSRKESISSADERWLDHEANTVDEERVLHDLEQASDYERGFERLDDDGKAIVMKLKEWAGEMAPDRGLSDRKQAGVKGKKVRLTYALTSNVDGSEKLPPFVIGKAAKPRTFKANN
ncbi:hypothetical protein GALMADRAFT_205349 [Galerina marginata CBS 339.88]|uniref:DDE-1 domain-containing protein n=1 Tax=Galerina marginata (strain CBS 339.88) TaxID=685588 RepID=A0A067TLV3_GALM3|nr:hypothetical protein GALMADRAFT_205349 [Galerina marginata CBS 339.88]